MFCNIEYLRITFSISEILNNILFSRLFVIKSKLFPNLSVMKLLDISILGWGLLLGPPWAPESAGAQAPLSMM